MTLAYDPSKDPADVLDQFSTETHEVYSHFRYNASPLSFQQLADNIEARTYLVIERHLFAVHLAGVDEIDPSKHIPHSNTACLHIQKSSNQSTYKGYVLDVSRIRVDEREWLLIFNAI